MACECMNMAGIGPESFGKHHHVKCPKYKTEKFPYLFYLSDAWDAWIPAPEKLEDIIDTPSDLDSEEEREIKFKRVDLTDCEFDSLPDGE